MDFTRTGGNFGTSFTRTNQVDGLTAARQDVYSQMESRMARLLSIFSFAVLTPASMPTISERNVEVDMYNLCDRAGIKFNAVGQVGATMCAVYGVILGMPVTIAALVEYLASVGYSAEQVLPNKQILLDIMALPFDKSTVKTVIKGEKVASDTVEQGINTRRNGRRNRNKPNVSYKSTIGELRQASINLLTGKSWRQAIAANGLVLNLVATPSAIRTPEAARAMTNPNTTFDVVFIDDKLVIVAYGRKTVSQILATGFSTEETIHDVNSHDHQVVATQRLQKLIGQGWLHASELGIKDVKAFLASAPKMGTNTLYGTWNDLIAAMDKSNPKIKSAADEIHTLVAKAEGGVIDTDTVNKIRARATTVFDDANSSMELVGAGASSSPFGSFVGGMPSFGAPYGTPSNFGGYQG